VCAVPTRSTAGNGLVRGDDVPVLLVKTFRAVKRDAAVDAREVARYATWAWGDCRIEGELGQMKSLAA